MNVQRRKLCFTLIELLVVVAIISIMLGIVVSSPRLLFGAGVDAATRSLSSASSLARQYAISQRRKVAILFPDARCTPTASSVHYYTGAGATGTYSALTTVAQLTSLRQQSDDRFSKSMGFCFVTGTASPWTFNAWVPNTKWEYFPSAVAVVEVDSVRDSAYNSDFPANPDSGSGTVVYVSGVPFLANITGITNPDQLYYVDNVPAIVFRANGALASGDVPYYVTLAEYVATTNMAAVAAPFRSWIPRNRRNWVTAELNAYTGKTTFHNPGTNP